MVRWFKGMCKKHRGTAIGGDPYIYIYVPWTFRYNVRSCLSFPIKTIECFMPEACQSWVYGLANSLILGNKSEGAFLFFRKNETTMK